MEYACLLASETQPYTSSPTQAMLLAFKPTGLIHLYGRRNSAGVVTFVSVKLITHIIVALRIFLLSAPFFIF